MRYIANSNGYLLEISFGAMIECNGKSCTEYTGGVPSGYSNLPDWATKEADKLYRWQIVDGELTLDVAVPDPKILVYEPMYRNLLDNSDFTNPVNQRGVTNHAKPDYFIDSWLTRSVYLAVTVSDDGITFKNNYTGLLYPEQRFRKGTIKAGDTYTAVAYLSGGKVTVQSIEARDGAMTASGVVEHGVQWFVGNDNADYDRAGFFVPAGSSVTVLQVALYEGEYTAETVPKYQPKGYPVEMLNCNGGATAKVKLWTNANLANSFNAQTISLDLSGYAGVEIVFYVDSSTNVYQTTGFIPKGLNSVLWYTTAVSGHRLHREFTAADTGVSFIKATNYSGSATADKICIPYIIYGVKGVS